MTDTAQSQWTEDEFTELLDDMVTAAAPRLFAVVREHVPRRNARIAAWGLLHADDRVDVTTYTEGWGVRHRFDDIDRVERRFSTSASITARLVWVGEPPA